jgi:acyl carrier protein
MPNSISNFICDWVCSKTNARIEDSDDLFFTGKLDSLLFAELVAVIEHEYTINIDFSKVYNWDLARTPAGLSELIQQ